MMPGGHTARGPLATRVAAGLALLLALIASPARAADPPSLEDATRAALAASRWVQAFDLPDPDAEIARHPAAGASAMRAALRARGRLIASEHAHVPLFGPASRDQAAVSEARLGLLRQVMGRALASSLGDRVVAALRDTLGDDVGRRLTLELEVAGPLVPMAGQRLEDVIAQVEPGLDGLALRWEDRVAFAFPSEMVSRGAASDLARILPDLATQLGLPVTSYRELRDRFDARLYRFRVHQFVQRRPGDVPRLRYRGQEVVDEAAIIGPTITAAGRELFNHLVSRLWAAEEPVGMRGDYDAGLDTVRPLVAPAREQALAAYAMARWSGMSGLREGDRHHASAAAVVLLDELRLQAVGERPPLEDPLTAAAIVLAESALRASGAPDAIAPPRAMPAEPDAVVAPEPRSGAPVPAAADRAELLARATTDVTVLLAALAATADEDQVAVLLTPHDQAVLVAAAAAHALAPGDLPANGVDELEAALAGVRGRVITGELISLMPWLGMAERDIARLAERAVPAEQLELFQAMRAVLTRVQVDGSDAPDLAGGFALADAPIPLAGAQSVRPTVLLAWMIGRPGIDDVALGDPEALAAHRRVLRSAMRFLRQLAVRDADLWAIRTPSRAIGGLRAATWDLRMPLAAQAMGLIAYAEALEAIERVGPLGAP